MGPAVWGWGGRAERQAGGRAGMWRFPVDAGSGRCAKDVPMSDDVHTRRESNHAADDPGDRALLDMAARAAYRGLGNVEPNPLVGAVISRVAVSGAGLSESEALARVVSVGHHRRFGDVHAEVDTLARARALGADVRGCIMHVTLEPCNHTGKQPPCTGAIVAAGIAEVVIARADLNPLAAGGAEFLRECGVRVRFSEASGNAITLSEPFMKRIRGEQPWVVAKWAQTIDGRIATRTRDSKWISSERSRRHVHLLRARVDAIITGVGTLAADNPMLTARDVPLRRDGRAALRVLVDPMLRGVIQHLDEARSMFDGAAPVLVVTLDRSAIDHHRAVERIRRGGASVLTLPAIGLGEIDLGVMLATLRREHNVNTAMIEAGGRLTGWLMSRGLIDECQVYIAPMVMGDPSALGPANTTFASSIAELPRWRVVDHRAIGPDIRLVYRKAEAGWARAARGSALDP